MLYAAVFLVKVRVSNSRFSQLVDGEELEQLLLAVMRDCQVAAQGDLRHSAMTCLLLTRALGASWKALETGGRSRGGSLKGENDEDYSNRIMPHHPTSSMPAAYQPIGLDGTLTDQPQVSLAGPLPGSPAPMYISTNPFTNPFAASSTTHTPLPSYRNGVASGPQTPSTFGQTGFPGLDGSSSTGQPALEGVDNFLSDSHFFNSLLIGRGASGFFDWQCVQLLSSSSQKRCSHECSRFAEIRLYPLSTLSIRTSRMISIGTSTLILNLLRHRQILLETSLRWVVTTMEVISR